MWPISLYTPPQTPPAENTNCFDCACSLRVASECSSVQWCANDADTTSRESDFEPVLRVTVNEKFKCVLDVKFVSSFIPARKRFAQISLFK